MPPANPDPARSGTLDQRIRETEQQLANRQRLIGTRAAALRRNFREVLGSPIALLVAAGAGFALGQFSKRKAAQAVAAADLPCVRPSIFTNLMEALTLAGTVIAMLPAMRREPAPDAGTRGETP